MGQQEGGSAQSKRRAEDLPGVDEGRVEGAAAHLLVADDPAADVENEDPEALHLEASQLGREQADRVRWPANMDPSVGSRALHFSTKFEQRGQPPRLGWSQTTPCREARRREPCHPVETQRLDGPSQRSPAVLGEATGDTAGQLRGPRGRGTARPVGPRGVQFQVSQCQSLPMTEYPKEAPRAGHHRRGAGSQRRPWGDDRGALQ